MIKKKGDDVEFRDDAKEILNGTVLAVSPAGADATTGHEKHEYEIVDDDGKVHYVVGRDVRGTVEHRELVAKSMGMTQAIEKLQEVRKKQLDHIAHGAMSRSDFSQGYAFAAGINHALAAVWGEDVLPELTRELEEVYDKAHRYHWPSDYVDEDKP